MSRCAHRFTASAVFAGVLILNLSSCATQDLAPSPGTPTSEPSVRLKYRIAQVSFGRDASFALCAEPACPTVTKKTISSRPLEIVEAPRPAKPDGDIVPVVAAVPTAAPSTTVELAPLPPQPRFQSRLPAPDPSAKHVVVNFAFASAELTSTAKKTLLSSLAHARAADTIVISGRTDSIGDLRINEALALARSMAVRNYLRDVAPDINATISIDAKGRCCFIASNADEQGRSQNRRVQVVFNSSKGAM